jgi:hypothetical protein
MESKFSVKDRILAELRKSGNAKKVRKECKYISLRAHIGVAEKLQS